MKDGPNFVNIAALIGDNARSEVLTALMADRALTATELADIAGVTKQTISGHLAKLLAAGLVVVQSQGRHRYYKLADREVAHLLESLMGVAFRTGAVRLRSSPREPALRKARVCYDHLAGAVGVRVFDALLERHAFKVGSSGIELSEAGRTIFATLEIDVDEVIAQRRTFCRECLDWSERRYHLAGALGAALLARMLALGWARRIPDSRIVHFDENGEAALNEFLIGPRSRPEKAATHHQPSVYLIL